MPDASDTHGHSSTDPIATDLRGAALLEHALLNKSTAFDEAERDRLGLRGLLPPHVSTLGDQVHRTYEAYGRKKDDLERHIYLRALQDRNETLFYRLVIEHLPEMMPILYTPTVGEACQTFSEIYRRPRGLFISYPDRDKIDRILDNVPLPDVQVIVATDGERILGLGDQGAGGMGIPIGKLSLYTACGGIDPATTLPILLDVGTNNQERLDDPLYIGWRHERVTGQDYDDFLDRVIQAVKRRWPNVLFQFEDFAQTHAGPLLNRYRDQLCTFNDDIQGTACVAVGTLIAAANVVGRKLSEMRFAFLGAGAAGCGIATQIMQALVEEGLPPDEARRRMFMVDRYGLLHDAMPNLLDFQKPLAQPADHVRSLGMDPGAAIGLDMVADKAGPDVLLGVSGQPGLFTETIIRTLAARHERPIVFPLSNPTSRVEATPAQVLQWSDGRALVASGSPFAPVTHNGKTYPIAQCNNSYIFPGMGLGILAVGATRVSDAMFMAASRALGDQAPALTDKAGAILPPLADARAVSVKIAEAVARQAVKEGLAPALGDAEISARITARFWTPQYRPIVPA
ncbi:MAG: NAD-dependent malic enzyme [Sneathiellaceae bacterium]